MDILSKAYPDIYEDIKSKDVFARRKLNVFHAESWLNRTLQNDEIDQKELALLFGLMNGSESYSSVLEEINFLILRYYENVS